MGGFPPLAELMESLRQAERKNWSLDQHHIANLCDSLNHFLTQTGQLPHLGGPPPQPPRISESCAMNSNKQEQPMSQGGQGEASKQGRVLGAEAGRTFP